MAIKPIILSTRSLTDAVQKQEVKDSLQVLSDDYIGIEDIAYEALAVNQVVLFTSQNAVKSVLRQSDCTELKQRPAICVGIKTKELLESKGWKVLFWSHYAKDLAPMIVDQLKHKTITFFCGNIRRDLLPNALKKHGIDFNEFTVYKTVLTPKKKTSEVDGICFYSPSAIESYLQQNKITNEICFCIGETTAEALKGITQNIVLAAQPTIEATLQACVDYYK